MMFAGLWLYVVIAWAASLAGVGYWQNEAGHIEERSVWQTRDNAALRLANAKIITLAATARKTEQDHAAALGAISTDYQRRLSDATKQRAADAAAIRAGTLRLRDPNPPGLRAAGCGLPETGASASRRDGRATGELSPAASGFLFDLNNDADQVAEQLASCQRVVMADRGL